MTTIVPLTIGQVNDLSTLARGRTYRLRSVNSVLIRLFACRTINDSAGVSIGIIESIAGSFNLADDNSAFVLPIAERGDANGAELWADGDLATVTGPAGPTGPTGAAGAAGATGPQGVAGSANISGSTGSIVKFLSTTSGGDSIASELGGKITIAGAAETTGRVQARTAQGGGWKDLLGPYVTRGSGPTIPVLTAIGSGVVQLPKWQIGDLCISQFHVPHDYQLGTDIFWHVHYTTDGTSTAIVKWQFRFYYAEGYGLGNFGFSGAPTIVDVAHAPSGVADDHYIAETVSFAVTGMVPDGFVIGEWSRVTNGGVDNANGIYAWNADIHQQSTEETTANRNGPWGT